MSSAGRAANSNGCVSKPKEHATGLIGFAAQIRRSLLIGSCAMETAEHREPCESRGSRTDLGAPGGEIPPGDSTVATNFSFGPDVSFRGEAEVDRAAEFAASVENDPGCVKTLRGIIAPEFWALRSCGEQKKAKICLPLDITTKSDFVFTHGVIPG